MIGIDLFAGSGGMSLGAEYAGITVKIAVEKDINAAKTYKENHPDTSVIVSDIRAINEFTKINKKEQIVVFGGPPCQGYSTSNRRTNNENNPQNLLYKEFVRIVKIVQPEWVVFENVVGFIELGKGMHLRALTEMLTLSGYTCSYDVLLASEYGIPQKRKRFFLIGSKKGKKVSLELEKKKEVTVSEAISDLPIIRNGASVDTLPYATDANSTYARRMRGRKKKCSGNLVSRNAEYVINRYRYIKQGQNWKAIPPELMGNYKDSSRCHSGVYYRLREDRPSIVIGNYRKSMLIHPNYDRGLSVREAARLQSFPDWYTFTGTIGQQQQLVGNAVPPLMAQKVFGTITL